MYDHSGLVAGQLVAQAPRAVTCDLLLLITLLPAETSSSATVCTQPRPRPSPPWELVLIMDKFLGHEVAQRVPRFEIVIRSCLGYNHVFDVTSEFFREGDLLLLLFIVVQCRPFFLGLCLHAAREAERVNARHRVEYTTAVYMCHFLQQEKATIHNYHHCSPKKVQQPKPVTPQKSDVVVIKSRTSKTCY